MLSLVFLGLGAKFLMISRLSSSLPYLDQWDGEAIDVYVRYFEHLLSFSDLFRVHNEHRIFFTRVYDLALFLLNGQWDSQLQMALNALIHCLTIAGFGWMMAELMGIIFWPVIWLPLALALVLPFGWENALWGFQSQFYFLLIFSLLTIRLLGLSAPGSNPWRLGILFAVGALFTIATGCLAAAAVAGLEMLKLLKQPRQWRRHLPTFGVCAAVVIAGLLLQGYVPRHAMLKAHTPGAFLSSLGANLAWPSMRKPWLAPLNLLPLGLLGWLYFRSREKSLPAEEMVLGVGVWVFLQAVSVAYARGVNGDYPAWRYMDSGCFIMIADCLAIALILTRYRARIRFRFFWHGVFAAWAAGCVYGLVSLNKIVVKDFFPWWAYHQANRLASARAFMVTDNPDAFKTADPFNIPEPYTPQLVFLLRLPYIRTNLPACVREPLKVLPAENSGNTFVLNGCQLSTPEAPTEKSWGSFSAQGAQAQGTFESLPIRKSALPYLEIPVAGDLGKPGLSLTLVDAATGKVTAVTPLQAPGGQWLNTYVKAPAGEFKLIARDESDAGWFAFKEPRELGRLSYWTIQILPAWKWFLAAGCALLLWNIFALRRFARTECSS